MKLIDGSVLISYRVDGTDYIKVFNNVRNADKCYDEFDKAGFNPTWNRLRIRISSRLSFE